MGLKKGFVFLFSIVLIFSMFGVIYAEEDISTIDETAVLQETAGTMPDSTFYFVDKFFDKFSDKVKVREEKVAEIRAMIEEENFEAALKALEEYKKFASELEREVSPGQREETRRSAAAIYNVLKSLEAQIPEEYKADLFDDVLEREQRIVTAVEIAGKIKELCEELSEIDPLQYSKICKTRGDSPKWHQDMDRDLTEEQKKEAKEFFDIMIQCFETSGEECRCEDISITPFAEKCSQIAPLAYACDVEGDEAACDKMDAIEDEEPIEDLLPDYLKDILRQIEDKFEEEQFDNHAPRECREVGATTREACMNVMFRLDAPQECVDALDRGEISLESERQVRESCERIMFNLDAPQECLDAGLTDFRECGILMFSQYAPQECLDAGLTGENRGDDRKCRKLVGGDFGRHGSEGPNINFNCQEISDSNERLECYDDAASQIGSYGGIDNPDYDGPCITHSEFEEKKEGCRQLYGENAGDEVEYGPSGEGWECPINFKCVDFGDYTTGSEGPEGPWVGCEALYCGPGFYCEYGECKQYEGYVEPTKKSGESSGSSCDDCASQCEEKEGQRLARTDCGENGCECYYESDEPQYAEGEGPTITETTLTETNTETTPLTGAVISNNDFFRYYYR